MEHLRDIMTTDVEYCTPVDNVFEVAVKMKQEDCGAIPICENGQLLGMITDRDIVIRGVAEKRPNSTQVTEIMSEKLITATPDMTVDDAAKMMAEKQIRRLPIVENNKLVGIVALGDIAVHRGTMDEASFALSEISESPEVHH
ncbi:MAG: CBS domain-containing protein [Bacillaceae bacterium]|uniref:CBS domain-containing protein n=1 Tax=Alkalihalobacterium chitinilyticum TaxID=2980103 RepID=A0ABT5VEG9_9BACI|nr:CBS domain-containing protein [Alkalihalobacterium chitinilyticum]MDE5413097.1 CBS domain-containing protein [Alkalihalobacterium chitinilyticum]MEB1809956.1 CBS domain-containing protein [Bacillaceae bacterium]